MGRLGSFIDAIPVIGHAKALVHLFSGDQPSARKAFTSANRLPLAALTCLAACVCPPEEAEDHFDSSSTTSPYERLVSGSSNGQTVAEGTKKYNDSLWRATGSGRLVRFTSELNVEERKCFRKVWEKMTKRFRMLKIIMPKEFSFTSGLLQGHPFLGLLHIFLRHQDDFTSHIKAVAEQSKQLPKVIQTIIREITGGRMTEEQFILAASKLGDKEFERVYKTLNQIQEHIYNFLKANLIYSQYLGEGCNQDQKVRILFRLRNGGGSPSNKKNQILAVCISREANEPEMLDGSGGDQRKIHTISTVFCLAEREALVQARMF